MLIAAGADVNVVDTIVSPRPGLLKVVIFRDTDFLKLQHGNTPLHFAAAGGHSDCILSLINSGAGVNQVNQVSDFVTVLFSKRRFCLIRSCCLFGSDQHGKSALFLAAECMAATSPECLRILILKKADVELKTAVSNPPQPKYEIDFLLILLGIKFTLVILIWVLGLTWV